MLSLPENNRKSEAELAREFEADLPAIQRGLFDLTAEVFMHLHTVEVTDPERMIDFVYWLAAMEKVNGLPAGIYQGAYSEALHQGQLESLLDNLLAAAVLEFAENHIDDSWSGTPDQLLNKLNSLATRGMQHSREWPQNAIALSKRLAPLQTSLLSQGIKVEFSRGKHRHIALIKEGKNHE